MDLQIAKFLHDAGTVLGVGGVTFLYLIETVANKEELYRAFLTKIKPMFGKFIAMGLILLIVSGVWLNQLVTWPIDQTMLTVKYVTIGALIINALYLNLFVRKKLLSVKPASEEFDSINKTAMISSTIGLILWWAIVVESVLL